jgi:hypothetical protein
MCFPPSPSLVHSLWCLRSLSLSLSAVLVETEHPYPAQYARQFDVQFTDAPDFITVDFDEVSSLLTAQDSVVVCAMNEWGETREAAHSQVLHEPLRGGCDVFSSLGTLPVVAKRVHLQVSTSSRLEDMDDLGPEADTRFGLSACVTSHHLPGLSTLQWLCAVAGDSLARVLSVSLFLLPTHMSHPLTKHPLISHGTHSHYFTPQQLQGGIVGEECELVWGRWLGCGEHTVVVCRWGRCTCRRKCVERERERSVCVCVCVCVVSSVPHRCVGTL